MRRGLEIRTRTTAAHHASSSQHRATRPLRDHPTTTTALEPKTSLQSLVQANRSRSETECAFKVIDKFTVDPEDHAIGI